MGRDRASQTYWGQTFKVLSLAGDEKPSPPWKARSDPSQRLLLLQARVAGSPSLGLVRFLSPASAQLSVLVERKGTLCLDLG